MMSSNTLSPSLSKAASYMLLDSIGAGDISGRQAGNNVNRAMSLFSENPDSLRGASSQLLNSRPGTPQIGGAAAAAAAQQQQRVFRRVAVMMDLSAAYSADGLGRQSASASIAGLAVKTHTSFSGGVATTRGGPGLSRVGSVLEPRPGGQHTGASTEACWDGVCRLVVMFPRCEMTFHSVVKHGVAMLIIAWIQDLRCQQMNLPVPCLRFCGRV